MDLAKPRRWRHIAVLAAIVGLYWLAMFVGTHLPIRTTPQGDPYSFDKLEHIAAFAALSVLLSGLGWSIGIGPWKVAAAALLLIAVYGAVDEASQSLVQQRTPDFLDWLADVFGAALGIIAFSAIRYCYLDRPPSSPP